MKKLASILIIILLFFTTVKVHAQFVVVDPASIAQGILNSADQITQTVTVASNTMKGFQESVKIYEQAKKYYDALKSVNNLVKNGKKVQQTLLMVGEISEMYISNFRIMLSDNNFKAQELTAISFGYAKLLEGATDAVSELRQVVNVSSLSMSDKERMDIIDKCYYSVLKYRNLVSYYTRKNISVSYLRAKKNNDANRVIALYGTTSQRYW